MRDGSRKGLGFAAEREGRVVWRDNGRLVCPCGCDTESDPGVYAGGRDQRAVAAKAKQEPTQLIKGSVVCWRFASPAGCCRSADLGGVRGGGPIVCGGAQGWAAGAQDRRPRNVSTAAKRIKASSLRCFCPDVVRLARSASGPERPRILYCSR